MLRAFILGVVQGLTDGSPSQGKLQEDDAIESIDGRPTPDTDSLDAFRFWVVGALAGRGADVAWQVARGHRLP